MSSQRLHAIPPRTPGEGLRRLEAIMEALRSPEGCPWDREQTLSSLKPYLIEEAYELIDAIDEEDVEHHREELGDVLLQVVFQAQLRKEQGDFALDDVAHAVSDKLVRRHPHVFGDVEVRDSDDVLRQWERIKKREGRSGDMMPRATLAGVPSGLPGLLRAQRIQSKCAKAGFDWNSSDEARAKVSEEMAELDHAIAEGDREAMTAELGDLLFALVGFARRFTLDAEEALRSATARFIQRYEAVEQAVHAEGIDLHSLSVDELVARWNVAKQALRDSPAPEAHHRHETVPQGRDDHP